jgi:hypothetical protein
VKAVHDAKSEELGPGIFRFKVRALPHPSRPVACDSRQVRRPKGGSCRWAVEVGVGAVKVFRFSTGTLQPILCTIST